jgi:hypothetical protein
MDRACNANGGRRGAYIGYWLGKLEDTTRKTKMQMGDSIKMDRREIRWNYMDWIDLAQDRDQWRALMGTVMILRVPYNAGNF